MRPPVIAVIVLCLSAVSETAQTPAVSQETGRVTFRAVVVDAGNGFALRGARVMVMSGRRTIGTVTTDEEGRIGISVAPEPVTLRIVKAGYASIIARVSPAQVRASDPVRLEVPRAAVITGRAVDASGEPAMLVIVRRLTSDGLSWSPPGLDGVTVGDGDGSAIVHPDARGEYRAAGLVAGRYTVEAYQPGRSMSLAAGRPGEAFTVQIDGASARSASVTVDVRAGEVGIDLVAPSPPEPPVDRAAEAAGGTIRGTVSTTDGSPLADAIVTAARSGGGPGGGPQTTTDASGRFTLRGVPLGSVNVQASKRGYVQLQAGQRGGGLPGLPVRIEAGRDVDDVSIVLPRSGAVTGLVVDEYGEPFQEVRVQLLRVRRQPTGALARELGSLAGQSDDRGQFRFSDVRPGDYVVMASIDAESGPGFKPEIVDPSAVRSVYVPAYYPETADFVNAAPIRIADGDEVPGVVLTMRRVPAARVTGIVHNSQATPFSGTIRLTLRQGAADLRGPARSVSPQPGGEFVFDDVPPGDYVVSAQSGPGLGGPEFGVGHVTVVDRDPEPVVMRTSPGSRVSGRIVLEGGAGQEERRQGVPGDQVMWGYSATSVAVDAVSLPGSVSNQAPITTGEPFTLGSLVGPTRLRVWSQDENWYLKSIFINGVDVVDAPFDFGYDGRAYSDVEAVFSRRGATITGGATNDRGLPLRDYAVYLFPTDRDRWFTNSRWVRLARAAADGGFTASSMPPGEYWVVALERVDASAADWVDTELLTTLASRAIRVTLGEGQSRTVSLRVINR